MSDKTGILLVNLGTPDSPHTADVRKYLIEFLTDRRVIDIPYLQRQLLVRGIIAPFRAPKSAKTYQAIWTENGSPLLYYSQNLQQKVQAIFDKIAPKTFIVSLAMRYQSPSIASALAHLQQHNVKKVLVLPLFPQYASATTGSIHEKVMQTLQKWWEIPDIRFINNFYDYAPMVRIFGENAKKMGLADYDYFVFSYHGLPERQIKKADRQGHCLQQQNCCEKIDTHNQFCYRAQCFATTKAIATYLQLAENKYVTTFQSRLGRDPWIQPYTSDKIEELAKKGIKKVMVFCPAFVADCLETIFEIGEEYAELFEEHGGEKLTLVPSLNAQDEWAQAVVDLVGQYA
ncbi:MAG: ferrochelatase [Chitinophagales bacterium]|nr:ferrochelatase [Bacteroidota bacterium]MCB9043750.1 ferrochelatase [Chitinophagales bacterium]